MKRQVIFLDIDSVLNCFSYGDSSYGNTRKPLIEPDVPLCAECVAAFKSVLDRLPDAAVVWSTSWALHDEDRWGEWRNPRKWLESQDWFASRLVGRTPRKMSSERHDEIWFWLIDNERYADEKDRIDVSNFAILDDIEYGMGSFSRHFFRSDYETGLTSEQADRIVEYLKTDDYNAKDWTRYADA